MAKKQSAKKRTQVKDLPREEDKLSAGDMKKIKGGLPAVQRMGDGSVRTGKTQVNDKEIAGEVFEGTGI